MKKEDFPCIAMKCMLYPVCLNKETIDCDYIKDYFRYVTINKGSRRDAHKLFTEVLPNARSLRLHNLKKCGYTTKRYRYYKGDR
jgi:hypothetical protein